MILIDETVGTPLRLAAQLVVAIALGACAGAPPAPGAGGSSGDTEAAGFDQSNYRIGPGDE